MDYNFSIDFTKTEVGYHTTLLEKKDKILQNGFNKSNNDDDWLGSGVYFWDKYDNAIWWKEKHLKKSKCCVFICDTTCDFKYWLDLDADIEFDKFLEFSKYIVKEMKKFDKLPIFKNNNQKKKFFCDVYCDENNYKILSRTFSHSIIDGLVGFEIDRIERRQICVKDTNCINIRTIKID